MFYNDLAELYDRAARDLGCKDLRLFLSSQASRLRMFGDDLQREHDRMAYLAATSRLIDTIAGMTIPRRRGNILELNNGQG